MSKKEKYFIMSDGHLPNSKASNKYLTVATLTLLLGLHLVLKDHTFIAASVVTFWNYMRS